MYQLRVEGMSCGHCVGAVTKAVKGVDAAASVEIDLASKTVKIESSSALEPIKAAIEDAGYDIVSA
jgi:copper chaperone